MALSRRTKIFIGTAGLAAAGTVAFGGSALADSGPEPVRTQFQIVDYQASQTDTPGRDCPEHDGRSVAEGTQ
ncbi:hypothetical protein [Actinomadura sp. 3N407]|uniref:hypothetical protein n=1 Tax=Actinomadura sp. 3N407 TaxID=3457423 RepID=UPI003FCD99AC